MGLSTDLEVIAKDLLQTYGDKGKLIQRTLQAYDPSLGDRPVTETSFETYYVQEDYTNYVIDTRLIVSGDLKLTFQTDITVDESYDFELYTGTRCNLLSVKMITSQDNVVIYEAQARTIK